MRCSFLEDEYKNSISAFFSDCRSFGFLCHVDLFPVPVENTFENQRRDDLQPGPSTTSRTAPSSAISATSASTSDVQATTLGSHPSTYYLPPSSYSIPPPLPLPSFAQERPMTGSVPSSNSFSVPQDSTYLPGQGHTRLPSAGSSSFSLSPGVPVSAHAQPSLRTEAHDVVAYADSYAIRESSVCTHAIVGEAFVQASTPEYKGRRTLMFVFSVCLVSFSGFLDCEYVLIVGCFIGSCRQTGRGILFALSRFQHLQSGRRS